MSTNDYPYIPEYNSADGKTPVTVTFEGADIVVIRGAPDSNTGKWTLDKNLKPLSYEHRGRQFFFSEGKFESMSSIEQTSAGHEHPVSREAGGVDMIPAIMANIVTASGKQGFPEELAKKIPAAFAALGLSLPDRRDPPG